MRDPDRFLAQLFGLADTMHGRHGWPSLSPWWRETLTDFYRAGVRTAVVRKGRRVGASTIIAPIVAVTEALHGEHAVPANDDGYYLFFSVKKAEALKRLRGIGKVLDALRIKYRETGDEIQLRDRPVIFRVQAASFRTAVGDTSIGAWCDELTRWLDAESGANPASEVLASVRPTLATMPNARMWLVSSPLGLEDAHAKAFELGNTPAQRTYFCATWEANPTLSEEQTRLEEPDEKLWKREYAAVPSASSSAAFEPDLVTRCFRPLPPRSKCWSAVGVLDSAAGKSASSDAMAWGTVGYALPPPVEPFLRGMVPRQIALQVNGSTQIVDDTSDLIPGILHDENGNPVRNPEADKPRIRCLTLHHLDFVTGVFSGDLESGKLWERIAESFALRRVDTVFGDQYGSAYSSFAMSQRGIGFREVTYNNTVKARAVYRLRQLMADDALVLPPNAARLKSELLAFTERITASGSVTYAARGAGKDDTVALLLNAAIAEEQYGITGALHRANERHTASR